MLLFAVTGLTLNNASHIESKAVVTTRHATPPQDALRQLAPGRKNAPLPDAVSRWLDRELDTSTAGKPAEWSADEIYLSLPRAGGDAWLSIDLASGDIEYERTDRGWISYLNDLHKAAIPAWPGAGSWTFAVASSGLFADRSGAAETARRQPRRDLAHGRPGDRDPRGAGPALHPLIQRSALETSMRKLLLPALVAGLIARTANAADLGLSIEVPRLDVAEYHRPYVAIWIENPDQSVAADLAVWYDVAKKNNEGTGMAQGHAPVVAPQRPQPAVPGGRRERRDQARRQARAGLQWRRRRWPSSSPASTPWWWKRPARSAVASCCASPSNGRRRRPNS